MTAALGASIARTMPAVETTAEMTTAAAQARALAGQKADPDQIVTRQIAVPKLAVRALVRPADRRCGARVAMMTMMMTMMTVRLGRAARKPVPAVQAAFPALVARRSLVAEWADLNADLKVPAGYPDSVAPQPLAACLECPVLAAFPVAGPVLTADQATSMIASPRWSADLRPSNGRCARIATKGVPREIAVPMRAVRKAAARKVGAVQKHDQKAKGVVPKSARRSAAIQKREDLKVVPVPKDVAGAKVVSPKAVAPRVARVRKDAPIAKVHAARAVATAHSSRR